MNSQRYSRNISTLSPAENDALAEKRVAVVGCGGLGGYIIEMLGRLGVGTLTAVDGDSFVESNLNRQLLADSETLGQNKAEAARLRMVRVNPEILVIARRVMLNSENSAALLAGHQVVVDALDSIPARLMLQEACSRLDIPLVHGAIAGWYGQVTTIFPGDDTLSRLYPANCQRGAEAELGNPSFTPALTASIQVAEVVKVLLGRGDLLRNKVLRIDLLSQEYDVLEVGLSRS